MTMAAFSAMGLLAERKQLWASLCTSFPVKQDGWSLVCRKTLNNSVDNFSLVPREATKPVVKRRIL